MLKFSPKECAKWKIPAYNLCRLLCKMESGPEISEAVKCHRKRLKKQISSVFLPSTYVVPTELHDVVQGGRGHLGPEQPMAVGYHGNHFVIETLVERHLALCEHLPHQHAWTHTNTSMLMSSNKCSCFNSPKKF